MIFFKIRSEVWKWKSTSKPEDDRVYHDPYTFVDRYGVYLPFNKGNELYLEIKTQIPKNQNWALRS